MDFFEEKIFPEEVDNIKSFLTKNISTNGNVFTDNLGMNSFGDDEVTKFSGSDSYYNGKMFSGDNYGRGMNSGRFQINVPTYF